MMVTYKTAPSQSDLDHMMKIMQEQFSVNNNRNQVVTVCNSASSDCSNASDYKRLFL